MEQALLFGLINCVERATRSALAVCILHIDGAPQPSHSVASLLTISTGNQPLRITRSIVVPVKMSSKSCLLMETITMRSALTLRAAEDPFKGIARDHHRLERGA